MIVEMRTCAQAARVAQATGGVQLPGRPRPGGAVPMSRWVDVGADFEPHRAAVEAVSTLFALYSGDAAGYAEAGELGVRLPTGWSTTPAKFELQWPADRQRRSLIRAHFGARRKVFNWALGQVKADMVSVTYTVRTPNAAVSPRNPAVRAGVDLGLCTLATVAAVDESTGEQTIVEYANPAPLRASLRERRRTARQLSRRIPGSRGWNSAKAKLTRLDRRCVHLRREATHQLTTELAREYGHVVIEDLDVAAMKRSMGRRAFRRSVSDAAMGLVRHHQRSLIRNGFIPSSSERRRVDDQERWK